MFDAILDPKCFSRFHSYLSVGSRKSPCMGGAGRERGAGTVSRGQTGIHSIQLMI